MNVVLWFDRNLGDVFRRGTTLYASPPGAVWAVMLTELVFPGDLEQESKQLLGLYGASAGGAGHLLLGDGVQLPPTLERWATVPDVPAAQLGSWVACLVSIDGAEQLALSRDFQGSRVFATTWSGRHLTVLVPSAETTVALRHRSDVDAPPLGWDQRGGGAG